MNREKVIAVKWWVLILMTIKERYFCFVASLRCFGYKVATMEQRWRSFCCCFVVLHPWLLSNLLTNSDLATVRIVTTGSTLLWARSVHEFRKLLLVVFLFTYVRSEKMNFHEFAWICTSSHMSSCQNLWMLIVRVKRIAVICSGRCTVELLTSTNFAFPSHKASARFFAKHQSNLSNLPRGSTRSMVDMMQNHKTRKDHAHVMAYSWRMPMQFQQSCLDPTADSIDWYLLPSYCFQNQFLGCCLAHWYFFPTSGRSVAKMIGLYSLHAD